MKKRRLFGIFPMIREIVSRVGDVHFRRYALLQTRWGNLFVHHILRSDLDADPHDHPFWFASLVLSGGYVERTWGNDRTTSTVRLVEPGSFSTHPTTDFHKLGLLRPTWTLVVTGPRTHDPWGYLTNDGWVDHKTYRQRKNAVR